MKTAQPNLDTALKQIRAYYRAVDKTTGMNGETGIFEVNKKPLQKIDALFAGDAVYERRGVNDGCYQGRKDISRFFNDKRSLIGEHQVREKDVSMETAVNADIANSFGCYFPDVDRAACVTVKVRGVFKGAECFTGEQRFVTGVSARPLPFDDYWVLHEGKIKYRYSDVHVLDKTPPVVGY